LIGKEARASRQKQGEIFSKAAGYFEKTEKGTHFLGGEQHSLSKREEKKERKKQNRARESPSFNEFSENTGERTNYFFI